MFSAFSSLVKIGSASIRTIRALFASFVASLASPCRAETMSILYVVDTWLVEPPITYCSICYYPALSVKNRNRFLKISHVSAKIIGLPTPTLSEIIDHAILNKARVVDTESDHPLSTFFHVLPSQRRYRCIKCKTSRYSRRFVPVAIAVNRLNCSCSGYIWNSLAFCCDYPIYFRYDHELNNAYPFEGQ